MLRTFLAIELEKSVREELVRQQQQLRSQLPSASWVGAHALHITLKFLGDTPEEEIENIREAVTLAVRDVGSFIIDIQGVGVFPNQHAPRILWAGISSGHDQLRQVAEQTEACVVPMGFPKEGKAFHPHVTLARIKRDHRQFGQALAKLKILNDHVKFGFEHIKKITFFRSELKPSGSVYTRLWEVPFQQG